MGRSSSSSSLSGIGSVGATRGWPQTPLRCRPFGSRVSAGRRLAVNGPPAPVDFEVEEATELHYWRKHPNLHGWMERLYREKGGQDANFNCLNLQLTAEDLDRLETAIRDRTLPHTEGFFFGVSDGSEVDDDLAFIAKARDALAAGLAVFYVSWW